MGDVVVHGHVADLGEVYGKARLSIAPLRFGAGLKGKVAESLGHGVPCVATSVGVEGGGLVHERDVLVADAPDALAREIVRLVTDDGLWDRLSEAGLSHARDAYSMESIATRVASVLDELGVPHL